MPEPSPAVGLPANEPQVQAHLHWHSDHESDVEDSATMTFGGHSADRAAAIVSAMSGLQCRCRTVKPGPCPSHMIGKSDRELGSSRNVAFTLACSSSDCVSVQLRSLHIQVSYVNRRPPESLRSCGKINTDGKETRCEQLVGVNVRLVKKRSCHMPRRWFTLRRP